MFGLLEPNVFGQVTNMTELLQRPLNLLAVKTLTPVRLWIDIRN
jgi:hypothetical protein